MPPNLAKLDDVRLKHELDLTLGNFVLDLMGIVDPTPTSDVLSAALSLWRGDWVGAGLSLLGVIDGIGDLAKAGKLGPYAQAVEQAIALARRDAAFAAEIRERLKGLKGVLARLPMDQLPQTIRMPVQRMRYQLDNFLADIPPLRPGQIVKPSREITVISHSPEAARNKAVEWIETHGGVFGPYTRPIMGRLHKKHTGKEIVVGIESTRGPKWEIRIDFDPVKGPHYNAKMATGPGKAEERMAFTFAAPAGVDPEQWIRTLMERRGDVAKRPIPPR